MRTDSCPAGPVRSPRQEGELRTDPHRGMSSGKPLTVALGMHRPERAQSCSPNETQDLGSPWQRARPPPDPLNGVCTWSGPRDCCAQWSPRKHQRKHAPFPVVPFAGIDLGQITFLGIFSPTGGGHHTSQRVVWVWVPQGEVSTKVTLQQRLMFNILSSPERGASCFLGGKEALYF